MQFDPDAFADRRRIKRQVTFWRTLAVVAIAAAIGVAVGIREIGGDHVARVTVSGLITDNDERRKMLDAIAADESVRAVVLRIESPGGTTVGAEALFESLRGIAARKPVVAVMGEVAASGGYIAALAADHIIARRNTITGSIGVIFQWAQVDRLLDKIGVRVHDVKTGPFKAEPSPFSDPDEEALTVTRALVADSLEWFVGLVAERRQMDLDRARELADGRIYTGAQAMGEGLVDAIGGEDAALLWLVAVYDIPADLPVEDWAVETGFVDRVMNSAAALTGGVGGVSHGGLVSFWRAQ